MTDDGRKQMEKAQNKIDEADIDEDDRDLIRQFDILLSHDGIGYYWHAKLLLLIILLAQRRDAHGVGLRETLNSRQAVLELLDWIKGGEYVDHQAHKVYKFGEKSQSHYRSCLRKFGKLLNDGELPQSMEIIYGGCKTKVSESAPKKWEVLLWNEDVVPLLRVCKNERDRALVAVAWDSGARPYEIRDLTYGDISQDGDFLKITVGGKNTPLRNVRLIIASPFLKKWLEQEHPANEGKFQESTPIWMNLKKNEGLSNSRFGKIIPKTLANRVDIDKPTNMRNFRKSRSSVLASREDIGRGDLEERQGWAKGSKIVGHYITRFGSGTDDKVAKSDGLDKKFLPESEDEELPDPAPVMCPNCSRWTPSYDEECIWCATTFNPKAAKEANHRAVEDPVKDEARRDLIEMVTNGDIDEEDIESAQELAHIVSRYPELLDYANEFQDLLERFEVDSDDDDDDGVGSAPKMD
jgi:site-specific recombinase XerD